MYQDLISSTSILLTDNALSLVGMHLNINPYVYNSIYVYKLKNFQRIFKKVPNIPESFNKVITIFNSLAVDKDDIAYKLCVKALGSKATTTF